jgi:hypothetical protein
MSREKVVADALKHETARIHPSATVNSKSSIIMLTETEPHFNDNNIHIVTVQRNSSAAAPLFYSTNSALTSLERNDDTTRNDTIA